MIEIELELERRGKLSFEPGMLFPDRMFPAVDHHPRAYASQWLGWEL